MATREETKKMVEVMNAYIEGREIEVKRRVSPDEIYYHLIEPNWNWERCDYRIKEKEVRHKYKAGDYVLVLDGSDIPEYTGDWAMGSLTGRIFEVKALEIYEGKPCYSLKGDEASDFTFDERGLALVKIGE